MVCVDFEEILIIRGNLALDIVILEVLRSNSDGSPLGSRRHGSLSRRKRSWRQYPEGLMSTTEYKHQKYFSIETGTKCLKLRHSICPNFFLRFPLFHDVVPAIIEQAKGGPTGM
uniref:Uncharacterized protein n=1 Tax=Compsopogon caeruleus TaxID=31354 RepID=A0A7S1TB53_9RHOD|mmetsp:Transcript_15624/g.31581  ORF Transcript_15624/g.31581 Transcript_15624/m.31581 type:complete len:114 (+) Transcript_15624:101-442(+)